MHRLLAIAAALVLLTACGGSDEDAGDTGGAATAPQTAEAETTTEETTTEETTTEA